MASTLTEYLASQEHLVREAALALPHQFSQCTYSLGSLRCVSQFLILSLSLLKCPEDKQCTCVLLVLNLADCVQPVQLRATQIMSRLSCEQ